MSVEIKKRFDGYLPVVVDVETSGVDHTKHALLEIAAIWVNYNDDGLLVPQEPFSTHVVAFEGAAFDPKAMAINNIDPDHPFRFALQFASSHDKHALSQLQQQLQIPNSHITEVVQNNTIHFVLLAGQYPSIHAAKIARDQLPPQALQQQPWIRPMKSTTQTMQTHS